MVPTIIIIIIIEGQKIIIINDQTISSGLAGSTSKTGC